MIVAKLDELVPKLFDAIDDVIRVTMHPTSETSTVTENTIVEDYVEEINDLFLDSNELHSKYIDAMAELLAKASKWGIEANVKELLDEIKQRIIGEQTKAPGETTVASGPLFPPLSPSFFTLKHLSGHVHPIQLIVDADNRVGNSLDSTNILSHYIHGLRYLYVGSTTSADINRGFFFPRLHDAISHFKQCAIKGQHLGWVNLVYILSNTFNFMQVGDVENRMFPHQHNSLLTLHPYAVSKYESDDKETTSIPLALYACLEHISAAGTTMLGDSCVRLMHQLGMNQEALGLSLYLFHHNSLKKLSRKVLYSFPSSEDEMDIFMDMDTDLIIDSDVHEENVVYEEDGDTDMVDRDTDLIIDPPTDEEEIETEVETSDEEDVNANANLSAEQELQDQEQEPLYSYQVPGAREVYDWANIISLVKVGLLGSSPAFTEAAVLLLTPKVQRKLSSVQISDIPDTISVPFLEDSKTKGANGAKPKESYNIISTDIPIHQLPSTPDEFTQMAVSLAYLAAISGDSNGVALILDCSLKGKLGISPFDSLENEIPLAFDSYLYSLSRIDIVNSIDYFKNVIPKITLKIEETHTEQPEEEIPTSSGLGNDSENIDGEKLDILGIDTDLIIDPPTDTVEDTNNVEESTLPEKKMKELSDSTAFHDKFSASPFLCSLFHDLGWIEFGSSYSVPISPNINDEFQSVSSDNQFAMLTLHNLQLASDFKRTSLDDIVESYKLNTEFNNFNYSSNHLATLFLDIIASIDYIGIIFLVGSGILGILWLLNLLCY
ncbi:hypothetical protein ADUPG1_008895 [Aduncisulcus paluster]|uniref:Uncharacterized protein n=2 Tax=Aduncisulcus paluster TaxID=2918883 RepID=A0ABQ5KWH6_9EUKA|nr:hypothetical protein ADUPG1_008895 [Aduncisulcus paluster]